MPGFEPPTVLACKAKKGLVLFFNLPPLAQTWGGLKWKKKLEILLLLSLDLGADCFSCCQDVCQSCSLNPLPKCCLRHFHPSLPTSVHTPPFPSLFRASSKIWSCSRIFPSAFRGLRRQELLTLLFSGMFGVCTWKGCRSQAVPLCIEGMRLFPAPGPLNGPPGFCRRVQRGI